MVGEGKLSSVLSEFARTLATEFPIQQILDHLVERIVGILPITSAGVTLIDAEREPRFVAASEASALRYERLQSAIGQGPCAEAALPTRPRVRPGVGAAGPVLTCTTRTSPDDRSPNDTDQGQEVSDGI